MKSQAAATQSSGRLLAFVACLFILVMIVMLSTLWSPLYRALKWFMASFLALMRL
eukprot:CAMPEP_0172544180 /NCGR_PEP_ID=MMETSP1067-20121228/14395_1 /TAXON_ID=265564 ORGANISM="Thalassiosira punctigera, Strain Tpunct2005C2" /NCGR_SAMPLE_ID=MMETSP1067 /ASSEMBLY_ACC=CAM_ASM_000444 /LENGTH=54 /DNA_ID=CAMNT_0013330703 /DNA_START=44 /DNA_END=205 /DNA_ORIENTATION=+